MKKFLAIAMMSIFLIACTTPEHLSEEKVTQLKEQVQIAKDVISQSNDNAEVAQAYQSMGIAYQALEQNKKALKAYEGVLALAPNDFVALNNSADLYEQMGDYERASRFILVLYVSNKTMKSVADDAIRIHYKAGMTQEAKQILEEFATLDTERKHVQFISDWFIKLGGGSFPEQATGQ